MRDWIREALRRYGQTAAVETADGQQAPVRAFLQPVIERGEQVPDDVTGIGWTDSRLWLYLGQTPVNPGDRILWNEMAFGVRSGRPYCIGDREVYWWASLEREKEAAE